LSALRDSLLPTLCRGIAFNMARQQRDLAIFETRRTYHPTRPGELPVERLRVAAAACGRRIGEGWSQPAVDFDFFDLKGAVELLMERCRISERVSYFPISDDPVLVEGLAAEVRLDATSIGRAGRIRPAVLAGLDIDSPVFAFEIDLSAIAEAGLPEAVYKPWSRFPGTTRDLALVMSLETSVGPLVEALLSHDPARIRGVEVFDVYQGSGLDASMKSVAVRLQIQSDQATLTADEIEAVTSSALKMLTDRFGIKLR
jgi:phenylalanyl-tRNA synthetase beta chain